MRSRKMLVTVGLASVLALTSSVIAAPNAAAANAHMSGVVTCVNGNSPEGVYVANQASSSRSGWANMWGNAGTGAKYYAYDGAYTSDYVRVHVGCGNNWNPTYKSYSQLATWYGDLFCTKEGINYECYVS